MPEGRDDAAKRWTWMALALGAACVEPIAVKLGYRAAATPYQTLLVRNVVAALAIFPLARGARRVPMSDAPRLVGLGALLFGTSLLTLLALARLSVAVVLSIVSLTPVAVAIASRRRALGRRFGLGVACGVAGAALATGLSGAPGRGLDVVGVACAASAVVTSIVYRLLLERTTERHAAPVVSTWIFATSGVLALALVAPLSGLPPAAAWWAGGWTGIAAAIANVGFVAVVHALGAARASLVMLLQRPFVIAIAALVLSERPGAGELAGVGLVLLGVWLGNPPKAPR